MSVVVRPLALPTLAAVCLALAASAGGARPAEPPPRQELERALGLYAVGAVDEALATLAALDARAADSARVDRTLRRARSRVVLTVGEASRAALFPLAVLELRLLGSHAGAGDDRAAHLAQERAAALADAYLREAGDPRRAASLFAALAGLIHGRSRELEAAPFYRRALDLDPDLPAALLGLAAVEEKLGRLPAAAALLERAATAAPGDREVRLRRSLVAARLGQSETALDGLDALVSDGGDDWIAALAHQQRAELLASLGRLEEALACSREGMETMPCDPSLPVVTAYYEERLGRPDPGLGRTLAACAERVRISPRALYNRRPQRLLDELWRQIETVERERLPALATALAAREGR